LDKTSQFGQRFQIRILPKRRDELPISIVPVMTPNNSSKIKTLYGWSHPENADGTGGRFVAVLEIPPVKSPETAVRASIVADGKKVSAK
jgi:hypothetical protein